VAVKTDSEQDDFARLNVLWCIFKFAHFW